MYSKKYVEKTTYGDLVREWKGGRFASVYLFDGGDVLQKDEAVDRLRKLFLPDDVSGMNFLCFDGETAGAGEILNEAQTLPFLGDHRLVVVRRTQEMAVSDWRSLEEAMPALPKENCLVLLWDGKAKEQLSIVQTVKTRGERVSFWGPFENQVPAWIQDRAKVFGKGISADAIERLQTIFGQNLLDLHAEMEKLALYAKDRPQIELSDVETLLPERYTNQFLELDRAIWKRDIKTVLGILRRNRLAGAESLYQLSQLIQAFRRLLVAQHLLSPGQTPSREFWDYFRIKTMQPQQEFLRALKIYSAKELEAGLSRLLEVERTLKTGQGAEDEELTLVVRALLRRQTPAVA
ncbi:MAG TPA: DNA polymerase III subunit delta [Elusimicrobiota bacterium]|nr:DNA polymerase III subunit delta [Elusimicrobiota bacterium]